MPDGRNQHPLARILRQLIPAPNLSDLTDWSIDELKVYYRRTDRLVAVAYPAIVACFGGLVTYAVYHFCYVWPLERPDVIHSLQPPTPWLMVLGIWCGAVAFGDTVFYLWLRAVLGRQRYRNYVAYLSNKSANRLHVARASMFGSVVFAAPLFITVLMLSDRWTVFTSTEMVNNPGWTLGLTDRRPYTDVAGVYEIDRPLSFGKWVKRGRFRVELSDGSAWTLPSNGEKEDEDRVQAAARLVAAKSGKPIDRVGARGE